MGYTHYWSNKEVFTNQQWESVVSFFNKMIADDYVSLIVAKEDGWDDYIVDNAIVFNGSDGDGYETFSVVNEIEDFDCCKTANKPYDLAVQLMLIRCADVNLSFNVRSDGDANDWSLAAKIYSQLTGRDVGVKFGDNRNLIIID